MKKVILILFLLFTVTSFADTLSGYWTETTHTKDALTGQLGYVYGTTALSAVLSDSVMILYSPIIGVTSVGDAARNDGFSGKKVMVGINISTAYDDVAADFVLQASGDGINWVDISTISADITPNVTGVQWFLVDLTSIYVPYYRLEFNGAADEVEILGKLKFLYAIPIE